jgi:hypothetical protein
LNAELWVQIGVLASLVLAAFGLCYVDRPSKDTVKYGMVVFFSVFDSGSDLLFIMTAVFYRKVMFGCSVAFFSFLHCILHGPLTKGQSHWLRMATPGSVPLGCGFH